MIEITVGEIAAAVEGAVHAVDDATVVHSVVVDSRAVTADCMFVAVVGERVDGHDFAPEAIAHGAVVVLAGRRLEDVEGRELPCIVVTDPVRALGQLAARVRSTLRDCSVIAITGSSGKTSTKDLVASVLSEAGPTTAAVGSFNTEIGVPLTILAAGRDTRFLVLEMGMRGAGHISYLAQIARPDVGVVVNVGSAHVGMLGSRAAIAAAKAELPSSLGPAGTAILNADDQAVLRMGQGIRGRVVTFGTGADAAVRAEDVRLDDGAHASFRLVDDRSPASMPASAPVTLKLVGEHHVANALAAAATALSLGMTVDSVAGALSAAEPGSRWRMEIGHSAAGVTVINDAYNANPDSMRAALRTLAVLGAERRTWAVLGEMLELGSESAAEHEEIGALLVELGITRLVCVGEGTLPIKAAVDRADRGAPQADAVDDVDAAVSLLTRELGADDVVLVKASRGIGLESVAERLLTEATS